MSIAGRVMVKVAEGTDKDFMSVQEIVDGYLEICGKELVERMEKLEQRTDYMVNAPVARETESHYKIMDRISMATQILNSSSLERETVELANKVIREELNRLVNPLYGVGEKNE